MNIITYNVNGIRAAIRKGFLDWVTSARPDVLALQEVKALPGDWDRGPLEEMGYHIQQNPALRKGYSGVALISRTPMNDVMTETGIDWIDAEGRVISAVSKGIRFTSLYFPSGTNPERQVRKLEFLSALPEILKKINPEGLPLVLSGDFNICHTEKDIHDPIRLDGVPGFTMEERKWMDALLSSGFVDAFRQFNPDPDHYSWWSYMARARERNKGWRIDYHMVDRSLAPRLSRSVHLISAKHSDHCPVLVSLD